MTSEVAAARPRDWWNVGLWVVQLLLAAFYLMAAWMKLTVPMTGLVEMGMGYVTMMPEGFIRLIGILEALGAIGLVLPAATRILPVLTPLAAAGLVLVQVGAIIVHGMRGETAMTLPMNLVLLALAVFVVWGRLNRSPITARS